MEKYAIIIGVGSAGGHALQYIYKRLKFKDEVDFLAINLHKYDLEHLEIPSTNQFAFIDIGNVEACHPESGRALAFGNAEKIQEKIESNHYKLAFIIAGMGGITGMGAAPVIAEICRNTGIYTIAICSLPASFEGPRKQIAAITGLNGLMKEVNNIAVFSNNDIFLSEPSLTIADVFQISDRTFYLPIEIMLSTTLSKGPMNLDYYDLQTTLSGSKTAIFASGKGQGEKKVTKAVESLKTSFYLVNRSIADTKNLMMTIFHNGLIMDEMDEIQSLIDLFSNDIDLTWGGVIDTTLQPDEVKISIILTGIEIFS